MDYKDLAFTDETGTVQSHINIGSGKEVSIKQLAEAVAEVVGYQGAILWDSTKPDGTMRKLMDSERIKQLGWIPTIDLKSGIGHSYKNFIDAGERF